MGVDRSADAVQVPKTLPETVDQLEAEVTQLRQALHSHAVIDQALGVIVTVGGVTPDEAWDIVRETSMCTNIKLRRVAESLVAWAQSGNLPAPIRDVLRTRLNLPRTGDPSGRPRT